jgi:peptide/nickel transport system permease protein
MVKYIGKRLGWAVAVLLCVTIVTFVLSRVVPADPAASVAGLGATPEQIAAIRAEMGLDKPLPEQYGVYMKGLIHGDLGTSIRTGRSVTSDLGDYLPATFELVAYGFAIYLVLAVGLGTLAATSRSRAVDGTVRVFSIISSGAPVFWIGMLLQLFFFAHLGWLPAGGRIDVAATPPDQITGFYTLDYLLHGDVPQAWEAARHLILPVATVVLSLLGVGVRLTRGSVATELEQGYVRTAHAKGLNTPRIVIRHVLKNALNPVVSMAGVQLGYLFAWIILVETIFQWPGIGSYAFESFQALDYAPIMSLTLVISAMFVLINLAVDLVYPLLDPRIRLS